MTTVPPTASPQASRADTARSRLDTAYRLSVIVLAAILLAAVPAPFDFKPICATKGVDQNGEKR